MRTIQLRFRGYWGHETVGRLPSSPGVFCVYSAWLDCLSKRWVPSHLIYIGHSLDARHELHEVRRSAKWQEWESHLPQGQTLCFSFAPILIGRTRSHAALVHRHRPPANGDSAKTWPAYGDTRIELSGDIPFLHQRFAVPDATLNLEGDLKGDLNGPLSSSVLESRLLNDYWPSARHI